MPRCWWLQGDTDTQPVIVALDAGTGEERWRHEPSARSSVVSAVSADRGTTFAIFTGLSETSVVAFDLADGAERWSRRVNSTFDVIAPPGRRGGVRLRDRPHRPQPRAFDATSGEQRWDFAQNAPAFRSVPVLVGAHLLVPTLEGSSARSTSRRASSSGGCLRTARPLRSLASAGEVLVATVAAFGSGVDALEHDPDAVLVREASPTTLAVGRMVGAIAIAAIPLLVLVLLLGRMLAARMGPAFPGDAAPGAEDEPVVDPWETDAEDPTP